MKIPSPRFPTGKESHVPGDTGWVNDLMGPRDAHIKTLTIALQGQTGLDNLNAELRVLDVFDEEPFDIVAQKVRGPIISVLLLATEADDYARLTWQPVSLGRVTAEVIWDVLKTERQEIALLLMGA